MPRNQPSSGGTGEVVVPLRRDDRSGLLDIHALSSIIDSQRRGGATAASVALPTFGTPWALQEVKPVVPEPRASAPARTVVVGPDHRPLYVMIAALSVAVASLGAYVLMRPTPTVVVERAAVVAGPELVEGEGAEGDAEAEAKAKAEAEAKAKAEAALLAAATEPSAEAEAPEATEPTSARARVPRTTRPGTPKTTPKTGPEPVPKDGGAISVQCVLEPEKCGKGKTKPDPGPVESNDEPSSSKPLPAAPSSSQIRDAMAVVKPQAKACGPRHGGTAGEKVRVKLSVTGSTGKITSAQALEDHAGTALGKCVADALSKAELPKFGKPQAGVMYAITL
jgi:hypothetical protein